MSAKTRQPGRSKSTGAPMFWWYPSMPWTNPTRPSRNWSRDRLSHSSGQLRYLCSRSLANSAKSALEVTASPFSTRASPRALFIASPPLSHPPARHPSSKSTGFLPCSSRPKHQEGLVAEEVVPALECPTCRARLPQHVVFRHLVRRRRGDARVERGREVDDRQPGARARGTTQGPEEGD